MRIYALVEGKTESRFIRTVLEPHLSSLERYIFPVQVTTSRDYHGGMTSFERVHRDLHRLKKQHAGSEVRFTTMFDLYSLPKDFPGYSQAQPDPYKKVQEIESALRIHFGDRRFLPYIQVHEFEALLFSDLSQLATLLTDAESAAAIERLRVSMRGIENPELINDRREASPSHRLMQAVPSYCNRKAVLGPAAAERIGLDKLRASCPHFAEWVRALEMLG